MHEVDLIARVSASAVALLLAVFMLRDARHLQTSRYFLFVAIGLNAFLIGNITSTLFPDESIAGAAREILSGHLAIFLWWFCLSVFDDEFQIEGLELAVTAAWLFFFLSSYVEAAPDYLSWGLVGLGLFIVCHIAWRLISDRSIDLVEGRRKYRYPVAAMPAGLLLVDLMIDLLFGFDWKPIGFTLTQDITILAGVLGLCLWGLDASPHRLAFTDPTPPVEPPTASYILPGDRKVYDKLTQLFEVENVFLEPSLKIQDLTDRLGIGEARLRRLINQGFGYRNFRQFLNAYRLKFACARLSSPAHANDKIVSVALDSGFASLASFNRVFKAAYELTPSAYRRKALTNIEVGPEILSS